MDTQQPNPPRTVVWLDPDQTGLVRTVAERLGLRITGIGSPQPGRSGEIAAALETPEPPQTYDDLRAMLASAEADLIWLAAEEDDPRDLDHVEPDLLINCRQRGVHVVSQTPLPTSVMQLAAWTGALTDRHGGDIARFCPLLRLAPATREINDILESFGAIRAIALHTFAATGQGSLGARLFDALDFITALMGEPDRIYCAFGASRTGRVLTQVPSDVLTGFHGDMSLTLAYPDRRTASIFASDRAASWHRSARLLGSAGAIDLDDTSFVWIDADGARVDEWLGDTTLGFAGIVADQVRRYLDPGTPAPAPVDVRAVLSTAGAALLSARTGEPESPATILRMADAD